MLFLTVVERNINHIKDTFCLAGRRTQNEKTLHADLILSGITQLITIVLADKIKLKLNNIDMGLICTIIILLN